jgi:hypothetical protein
MRLFAGREETKNPAACLIDKDRRTKNSAAVPRLRKGGLAKAEISLVDLSFRRFV